MAIAKDPSAPSLPPGHLHAGAWNGAKGDALRRELEAMGKVYASAQPGEDREAILEGHRQRIHSLLRDRSAEMALEAIAVKQSAPEQPEPPLGREGTPPVASASPRSGTPTAPRARLSLRDIQARRAWWHLDQPRLRRAAQLSLAIVGTLLVGLAAYSQRVRILDLGRSAGALGRGGVGWLEHRVQVSKQASPSLQQPDAAGPAPQEQSSGPAPHPDRRATGTRGAGGGASLRQASGASLSPAGLAATGTPQAHDGSPVRRSAGASADGGLSVSPPNLPAGSHQHLLAPLYDPSGKAVGWRLWVGGLRAPMFTAFDDLSAWCSARFGAGYPLALPPEPGEWRVGMRWITPRATVELRGRINPLREARIWAVDLRGGSMQAVEDAEVELTYQTGSAR